jgi:NADPH-dependent 7-cyano-7-deazaguanine reductase QueF-like protein
MKENKEKIIIMNNSYKMEAKYKSKLLKQIRLDFRTMEDEQKNIVTIFFTEEDVWSLYDFLLLRQSGQWKVIDDVEGNDRRQEL